jgi:hypothetical protein
MSYGADNVNFFGNLILILRVDFFIFTYFLLLDILKLKYKNFKKIKLRSD